MLLWKLFVLFDFMKISLDHFCASSLFLHVFDSVLSLTAIITGVEIASKIKFIVHNLCCCQVLIWDIQAIPCGAMYTEFTFMLLCQRAIWAFLSSWLKQAIRQFVQAEQKEIPRSQSYRVLVLHVDAQLYCSF